MPEPTPQHPATYIIDRIEENTAHLEALNPADDQMATIAIPSTWLPAEAQEGQALQVLFDLEASSNESIVRFVIDEELTQQRKEEMTDLRSQIPKAQKGNFNL